MDSVDTELSQLNLSEQLRANSSFMKIMATLFHYGNQSMSAAQLVSAVRTLDLLQLRGETPKSTVQGIISTSRKIARDLRLPDPFRIDKDAASRQAKYAIADDVLNGAAMPEKTNIPDEPIILRPVEHAASNHYYASPSSSTGKRARKTAYYDGMKRNCRKKTKSTKKKEGAGSEGSDIEVDSDEDFDLAIESEDETPVPEVVEEDTIFDYSLLYNPPPSDASYIDAINFSEYPTAAHFAIVQQKGYSYPRFRSHEKIKIPKLNCEDKFRVTDIVRNSKVVGRMFIIADGHGGPGCSEYFVRNTPAAVQALCDNYEDLTDEKIQQQFTKDIKKMVQQLDETYLKIKRAQLYNDDAKEDQHIDNDGCTLIINVFLGEWLVNINVGDSRSIVISAPEPSKVAPSSIENANTAGIDTDYKMDVVFASQDHKPYLEHLAREILENGGEFVDSVQNRVIKVELDKLKEDGNRHTKRIALKNARIRPKGYHQAGHDHQSTNNGSETAVGGWAAQSAVRTTAQQANNSNIASIHHHQYNRRMREDRIPSLNVARSCGDLDFKMDPKHKIISCEPDVTFIRISDQPQNEAGTTILANGPHKERRRHFLFMSTDGTFDYMYEETADRQNRAIAKVVGPMIEDGEKIGQYLLEEEERIKGQTIEHKSEEDKKEVKQEPVKTEEMDVDVDSGAAKNTTNQADTLVKSEKAEEEEDDDGKDKTTDAKTNDQDKPVEKKDDENAEKSTDTTKKEESEIMNGDHAEEDESQKDKTTQESIKQDGASEAMEVDTTEAPRVPLLHRELSLEETQARKIKERTLVMSARYFANRESAHGFFASTLQDYDDCTIILVEI